MGHNWPMLIQSEDRRREPEPELPPGPEAVDLDWRLWSWVAATIALFVAASAVGGLGGVLLAFSGFVAALKALESFLGDYGGGLHEWHQ
jgi:hypothetical protein